MPAIRAFVMPKWGIEMTEGLVGAWHVPEGGPVARGQILVSIETDKITNDVEAEFEGVLRRTVTKPGETAPVGALLAVFAPADTPDAAIDDFVRKFKPAGGGDESAEIPPPDGARAVPANLNISPAARRLAEEARVDLAAVAGSGRRGRLTFQDVDQARRPPADRPPSAPVSVEPKSAALEGVFASPLARRLAIEHGLDLAGIRGTGPRGRIGKADVLALRERLAEAPTPTPMVEARDGAEIVRLTPMRKAIARRLTEAKTTIPHFYLRTHARADALVALRETFHAEGEKITVNDLLVRACALALRRSPDVNIQVHGDEIHRFVHADISVAVATARGLLTPIVRAADTKPLTRIAAEIRDLAARAHAGKLRPEEFEGGTFSVSNLGMFEIDGFDAVINPPQGAILAIGRVRSRIEAADGGFLPTRIMELSLSCDHRAIDGAVGARFLGVLREFLEHPTSLLGE